MRIVTSTHKTFIDKILARFQLNNPAVTQTVATILAEVKARGNTALFEYTQKFDRVTLNEDTIRVSKSEINRAYELIDAELLAVIRRCAQNIRDFHEKQLERSWFMPRLGGVVGQMVLPLESVGVYVPGGTAAYPSSVLMNIIPAKVAGVERIVMATPPSTDESSAELPSARLLAQPRHAAVHPAILVAAAEAGAQEIYKMGGAQAVAALAYGTESVQKVDKITGPGNMFVAEAKRQVFGTVGIDSFAGPSEIVVIADGRANPAWVAADLLSQAEHNPDSAAIAITDCAEVAKKIAEQCQKQAQTLPRRDIINKSLEDNGAVIIVGSLAEAAELSNRLAPEHLELCVQEPWELLAKIKHAGAIFLGDHAPEPLGDYAAGPNHTLPTSTTARFFSPLSVSDFCKRTSVIQASATGLAGVTADIAAFARAECLEAHARSVEIRRETE